MTAQIYNIFLKYRSIAILIDSDKTDDNLLNKYINAGKDGICDLFLIGGSLIFDLDRYKEIIKILKKETNVPVIIFPGNYLQIVKEADGILFLQLYSGRNPEYIIGQQVIAAPIIYKMGIEAIPTAYILVDGGNISSTAYLTQTIPIPNNKKDILIASCLAAKYSGSQLIYIEAGSGADNYLNPYMLTDLVQIINLPIIVGGGIKNIATIDKYFDIGVNTVVIGNHIETNSDFLEELKKYKFK
jgi:putative glycerol-1-phosphate prenyltransferase